MKKLNELKQDRALKLTQMSEINKRGIDESRVKTDAEKTLFDTIEKEVNGIDEMIRSLEIQEELNTRNINVLEVKSVTTETKKSIVVEFRDWLKDSVVKGKTDQFNGLAERADPILSTTDPDMITKTVAPGIDILTSPAEAFLRKLGITFYTGLVGTFAVPSMAEDTATFVGEDVSALSADMLPDSAVLAPRRVTHTQSISRETLAQTNPGIYASILQNLVNGLWNAVTNDVFDTLDVDAATQFSTVNEAKVSFGTVLGAEASIGGLNIGAGAYVTTPSIKAYLKGTIALGTTAGAPMWNNNELNGYPVYGVPAANAGHLYFGDWSREAVGQWGGIEVIVDPYTGAKTGTIKLTAIGMFDTACTNKRAFAIRDVSV